MLYIFRIGPIKLLALSMFFLVLFAACGITLCDARFHTQTEVMLAAIGMPVSLALAVGAAVNACRMVAAFFGLAFRWRRRA